MKRIIVFMIAVLLVFPSFGQKEAASIDTLLNTYYRLGKFNGTALIAKDGEVLLNKGYGYRDAEKKLPNDSHSIYQLGSVTKQFTSAVILKLQSENKLSVNDKLSKFFPNYPKGDSITIKQLLSHTSGIYNYTEDENFMRNEITKSKTREQMMALFENKPLNFSPGTTWSYSNSNYSILGYIIEKVTNKSYEEMVREFIFNPLKMNHSGFDFTHLKSPDKTIGYFVLNQADTVRSPIVDSTISFAAGAIFSTTADLYRWTHALEDNTILTADEQNEAYTPVKNNYGYGWQIDSISGKRRLSHGGGIPGYITMVSRVSEDKVSVILLTNASNQSIREITKSIYAILYHQPYKLPESKKAITLDENLMKQYEGEYEVQPGLTVRITVNGNTLTAVPAGQTPKTLFAEKKDCFFEKEEDVQLEFTRNESGTIDGFVLHQGEHSMKFKKSK
ncbi:MAG TPA: serine hydrolase [Hanamia sp.]|nr:serine hydrolase [Hanamia sp.]